MGRRKKLINNTKIPQYKIEAIARCGLPAIRAFYACEEGQKEFADWTRQQDAGKVVQTRKQRTNAKGLQYRFGVIPQPLFCLFGLLLFLRSAQLGFGSLYNTIAEGGIIKFIEIKQ